MLTFTIECSNFQSAAEVENTLKDKKIRYVVDVDNNSKRKNKRARASNVTAEDIKDILAFCATHSDSSDKRVANHFNHSAAVINRIRNGSHPLCQKVH